MTLLTEYPLWFLIFCILAGALYTYILYRKENRFTDIPQKKLYGMMLARFLSVTVISFLLLSPLIKTISKSIEKPIIIFAQDNSESIIANIDSATFKNSYNNEISKILNNLKEEYEVETYTFGENLNKSTNFEYTEKSTNFTELFNELQTKYANRNVGALIISSDGIYNEGMNPVYTAAEFNFPIYTVALGDSSSQHDIILASVRVNKIAFLGNKFPIQATVNIEDLEGEKTVLEISDGNNILFSKEITATSNQYTETVNIELEAKKVGLQRYTLKLKEHEDEVNVINNTKDIIIEVIDSKQKILILANSPHPDVSAMRAELEKNPNFLVDYFPIKNFNGNLNEYNLVILHQLPSLTNSATTILSSISKNKIPVFFILGSQSSTNALNTLNTGLSITRRNNSFDEVQGNVNNDFSLFETSDGVKDFIKQAPPILTPFGEWKLAGESTILFYQRIRNIETTNPLLAFMPESPYNENKVGFLCGEGIWRWRLFDFNENGSHDIFGELINKTVQYLALQLNKEQFEVRLQNVFNENEAVLIEAETYNESFEPLTNSNISIEITNSDGNNFHYNFLPDDLGTKTYFLNAGIFPVGDYTYKASVEIGGKNFTKEGQFSVVPVNLEALKTVANHQLLYRLANESNGQIIYPNNLEELEKLILENENIVPVSYSEKELKDLIHIKLLLFFIVILLSVEWFARKYFGSY